MAIFRWQISHARNGTTTLSKRIETREQSHGHESRLGQLPDMVLHIWTSIHWCSAVCKGSKFQLKKSPTITILPTKLDAKRIYSCENGNPSSESTHSDAFRQLEVKAKAHLKDKSLRLKLTGDGCGGVYYVCESDIDKYYAVFKPRDEEYMAPHNPRGYVQEGASIGKTMHMTRKGFRIGNGALREYAAFLLDNAYGNFSGVPVTGITKLPVNGILKEGSLQEFVVSESSAEDMGTACFSVSQVHKIGILDLRLFNSDRHSGNILLSKVADQNKYAMTPIDHGLCLPSYQHLDGACFDWIHWPQSQFPFSAAEREYIGSLNVDADAQLLRSLHIEEECITTLRISTAVLQMGARLGFSLFEIATLVHREGNQSQPCLLEHIVSKAIETVSKLEMFRDEAMNSRLFCDAVVERVVLSLSEIYAELPKRKPRSISCH